MGLPTLCPYCRVLIIEGEELLDPGSHLSLPANLPNSVHHSCLPPPQEMVKTGWSRGNWYITHGSLLQQIKDNKEDFLSDACRAA